jgi:hypothetical protein
MAQTFDPSVPVAPVIYPRPVTGFRRLVQAAHPLCGVMTLLSTDASFSGTGNPNYTKYAFTPGVGPKQKTIHTVGTREVSWTIDGEITVASLGLLMLFAGTARGRNFSQLLVSQGTANSLGQSNFFFDNPDGNSLPWNQISLSGNPNAGLTFSLEGRATIDPVPAPVLLGPVVVSPPVPAWATGNDLVISWSLSHNTNLQPSWFNSPDMLPAYYRALDSEFTLQLTTAVALANYTLIRIGYGGVNLAEMVVTSENITFGDRNSPITYQVSSTNAGIMDQANAYRESVDIVLLGVPDAGYG